MDIVVHVLNSNKRLTSLEKIIKKTARNSIKLVKEKIPISNVDIVVYHGKIHTIEHTGIGGYTYTRSLILIPLNPDFQDIEKSIQRSLGGTIAHELYHCLRDYSYENKSTLLQSLINEGLADHFEIEVFGNKPQRWDKALSKAQILKLTNLAQKEYNSKDYNHYKWFFGTSSEIPRWTGYSLGFNIIKEYLGKHSGAKASTIYKLKEENFI